MDKIEKARATLKAGDTTKATQMIRWLLRHEPSADAWVLAAELTDDRMEKIRHLRQALALDAWHKEANRLLYKIEGATPTTITPPQTEWQRKTGERPVTEIRRQMKQAGFQQHAARQKTRTRVGCVFSMLFSMFFSLAVFRAAGLMSSGLSMQLASLLQQPTPIERLENQPLSQIDRPQLQLTPSRVEMAAERDVEVLDAGYMHEHHFTAVSGAEYAVYVQFISVTARRVGRNVMIVDPNGGEAMRRCAAQRILNDDTNVAYICNVDVPGRWRVLILGRDQESVGAYFVGVDRLDDDLP